MADDHEDGPVRVHLLGCAEEAHTVIGNEVCEVVLVGDRRRVRSCARHWGHSRQQTELTIPCP